MKEIIKKVKKTDIFALGPSSFLYYGLFFYVAPFFIFIFLSNSNLDFHQYLNNKALLYSFIGLTSFIFGYYYTYFNFSINNFFTFKKDKWISRRVSIAFITSFLIGLIFKAIRIFGGNYFHTSWNVNFIPESVYSLVGLFIWFSYIALAIAFVWYYYLRKNNKKWRLWRFIAYGTFIFEMVYALPTCSKMTMIVPVIIILIIRWYLWKRSFKSVIIAALFIFLLFPYANTCRNPGALNAFNESTITQNKTLDTFSFAGSSFLSRFNQLFVFSKIVEADLPKLYGSRYKNLFISLGPPRFIWPDKPLIVPNNNDFGKKIGAIPKYDNETSIGPTVLGDFYINFGVVGITIGMILLGALFSIFYSVFIRGPTFTLSGVMIYSVTWIHFMKGMENWFIPILAGYIKILVIMLVIHWFLTKQFKT